MRLVGTIKDVFRPIRDAVYIFGGYLYDMFRFYKYAGWRLKDRQSVRDFRVVKVYHRLEKSLSFRQRDAKSGWGAASELVRLLKRSRNRNGEYTYHEKIALKVLGDFVATASIEGSSQSKDVVAFLESNRRFSSDEGGIVEKSSMSLQKGRLQDPEQFFMTRFSVRDFDGNAVSGVDIERVIRLALSSPSVCNRQASFVYCITSRSRIDLALSLQNGNRGFGHQIPCLLVLCSDISAFDTSGERYQHWIDGGMFSMTIVWALHSLGIGSCCLNWSKGPADDMKLRKLLNIRSEHTVLMMLAVGMPRESLKVCYSARRPVSNFYSNLD